MRQANGRHSTLISGNGSNHDADGDGAPDPCEPAFATLFVDVDAIVSSDGSSWADAHAHLQTALTVAANSGGTVTTIRVAQGTYRPDGARIGDGGYVAGSGDRDATHQLVDGVTIEGGYAGFGEKDPSQREPAANETISKR